MIRRILPGVAALLLGVAWTEAVEAPGAASLTAPRWEEVAPGLEFARVEALRYCRSGSPGIAVVRVDPALCRIEPYHEREYAKSAPTGIDGWQRRLKAPVLLNAGLYGQDRRHLGVLRRGGRDVGGTRHLSWKGLLVTGGAEAGLPPAAVLDLAHPEEEIRGERYPHAVQSMMLLDRNGGLRVRRTGKVAPRSLVAQDRSGRIHFIVTEGSFTLWETGALLRDAEWDLVAALALDGGNEANLAVESEAVRYRSHQGPDPGSDPDFFRASATLPCVLAVWPRGR